MTTFHKVQKLTKKQGGQLHLSQTLPELCGCSDLVIFPTDGLCCLSDKVKISYLRVKMSVFQTGADMPASGKTRADNVL